MRQRNCIRAYAGTFGFYGELVPIAEVERHAKVQMRGFDKINRVPPSVLLNHVCQVALCQRD